MNHQRQFIVYACPTGELNAQLETYFQRSYEECGKNKAHNYMPHCTLTGFFTDELDSMSYYAEALEQAYQSAKKNQVSLAVEIIQPLYKSQWHGLELQAPGIKQLVKNFAQWEKSPTRQSEIRLKDWLHLSFAYGFSPESHPRLEQLARETINLEAEANWELRFYQRADTLWYCLNSWTLSTF